MSYPLLALSLLAACTVSDAPRTSNPPELGRVQFLRSMDAALERASAQHKPVFALFQEVPGCSTCKHFGGGPLSRPLFVEAIETLFVPVAIYNNGGGDDARALERFGEPTWNNPVVRLLDAAGKDLVPRRDGVYTEAELAPRISAALARAESGAPTWWRLVDLDARAGELERIVLAMPCFWEGQAQLGAIEGVADARPAFQGSLEVVDVRYDSAVVALPRLIAAARAARVADHAWVASESELSTARAELGERAELLGDAPRLAPSSDDLRALRRSELAAVAMTRAQAVHANAELARGADAAAVAAAVLSPRLLAAWKPSRESK